MFEVKIYPTHLTFVYTGSVSCSKPLRASKVCSFIKGSAFRRTSQCSILLCLYWVSRFSFSWAVPTGRQVLFSLFQDVFNVLDFVQRFNFLLEYSAMIFRYEISLVDYTIIIKLDYIFVIFMFAWSSAQFCIISSSSLHNFFQYSSGSKCSSVTICLISLASSSIQLNVCTSLSILGKIGFYLTFKFYVLVSQKFKKIQISNCLLLQFSYQSVSFNWSLELAWVRFIEFEIFSLL
ncbi:Hypothetical_protein [Hexamita inflata]|uniref:Hypothetical_protein n=1 Tax=Hexamita inflata TaxID=28002 RepID=A0AA86U0F4_9EUKA|nr:Hypothetical protein HINF_LOCUS24660 [Hexamita inflata]